MPEADQVEEWLARAKKGDDEAFELLLKALYKRTFKTIFEIVPCYQDVEEILQDSFYRFYRSLRKLREGEDPYYFLRRIAIRRAYTHLKRSRRAITFEEIPEDLPQLTISGRELPVRSVYELAWKLPPKQRMVFLLRDILGISDKKIAEAMGITETTVRRHASLARKALTGGES